MIITSMGGSYLKSKLIIMCYTPKFLLEFRITRVLSDCREAATWGAVSDLSINAPPTFMDPLPVDSFNTPVTSHIIEGRTVSAPRGEQRLGRRERAHTVEAIRVALKSKGKYILN